MYERLTRFIHETARAEAYLETESSTHKDCTGKAIDLLLPRLPARGRVLDVGCGNGYAVEKFKALGFEVTPTIIGSDECYRAFGLPIPFGAIEAEQNDLPFDDSSFDLVFARHVIEHSIAPYFTLHEFARVTKPGGWCYIEVPSQDTCAHHESNQNHYSILSITMWRCLIQRSPWKCLKVGHMTVEIPLGTDRYLFFILQKPNQEG